MRVPSLRAILRPGDTLLLQASAAGELLVAKLRLALTGALLLVPVFGLIFDPRSRDHRVGFIITATATVVAGLIYLIVRRDRYRSWIGFVSTIFDVTFISSALVVFLFLGEPHTAVNSKVTFETYFLAITATALRYDVRFCLLAGLLAVLEYLGIVGYASTHWQLNSPAFAPYPLGMFDWSVQVSRIILLMVAAALSASITFRAQSLRRLSAMDRMTNVYNRGYFDERLTAELSRARRNGQPLALVMLDVDHFKRFNDSHGHAAGDAALRAVSTLVRHAVRRSDMVARYGGEEFVLVMPVTTAEQAVDKLESIRAAVAELAIKLPLQQTTASVTFSAGVAVFPGDGVTADELLDQADGRLFQAKEGGRNRVIGPPAAAADAATVAATRSIPAEHLRTGS